MSKEKTGYPSQDIPWKNIWSINRNVDTPKKTLYQAVFDNNCDYVDDTAIMYYGNEISYGELFKEVDKCAKSLKSIGVEEGECVTLCTSSVPEAFYIVLACSRIGAIANFINPMFTQKQMADRINDTDAKWIFIMDEMYKYIGGALKNTCIENVVILSVYTSMKSIASKILRINAKDKKIIKKCINSGKKYYNWKQFIEKGTKYTGEIDIPYKENRPTVMVYSSGTTGASKGILLTNDGILSVNYYRYLPPFPAERGSRMLQIVPIWFSTGLALSVFVPLLSGLTVIPELVFSKETFAKDLKKYNPNITLSSTSLWMYASGEKSLKSADLSNMRYPISGGEKTNIQDEKIINEFLKEHGSNSHIYKGYGMCELGGTVCSMPDSEAYKSKPRGAGMPLKNIIISAFDIDTNEELKYGQHGELRVDSPARMKGYYKNKEATDEFFYEDENGVEWGCTGDIGYIDEDGEVFVLGRVTDSFLVDENTRVFNFDIEDAVADMKNIVSSKAVGMEIDGNTRPVLHLVVRGGNQAESETIKDVYGLCKDSLPKYAIPIAYKIRDSIPVHVNGKRDVESLVKERDGFVDCNGQPFKFNS